MKKLSIGTAKHPRASKLFGEKFITIETSSCCHSEATFLFERFGAIVSPKGKLIAMQPNVMASGS